MLQRICHGILRLSGWSLDPQLPDAPRYVLLGAPHTSNWDFVLAMLAMGALRFRFRWVAKHTLFFWPLGPVLRWLGGIPVDRTRSNGFIGQMAEAFQQHPNLVLAITPEGTRSLTRHWKSGFYHLARQARVPVALGYIDFSNKRLGIGKLISMTGDQAADMAVIRDFYTPIRGRYPGKQGPIQLREESRPPTGTTKRQPEMPQSSKR